ncbi:MAG: cytochrome c class I [Gammaproteobacteria bacterium]|nr:MAG: cytochrome c class I [Gammaproteobacteria bacterium]TND06232.1 MAG: cytochrome c, class I [Gammaproteobacteria bacterium]
MSYKAHARWLTALVTMLIAVPAWSSEVQQPAQPAAAVWSSFTDQGSVFAAISESEVIRLADVSSANVFNQNLKKHESNLAPPEDGIHDSNNEATFALQPPKVAFKGLPETTFGNQVDWVKSIDQKALAPRWDRVNPDEEPFVLDMDIVRPVKASMPDVVFPHRQHTEWLACSNCHPAIFIPQKGANQISMSAILLGEKCGVCHGKVSFPIETKTCKKCHSKPKPDDWKPPLSSATTNNPWK